VSGPITRIVPVGPATETIAGVQPDPDAAALVSWAAEFIESLDPWELDELERVSVLRREREGRS
jgi:hypothetical protein